MKRVSPSRYWLFAKCALREVWASARVPALLPTPPTAMVGSAIHRLIAEAAAGLDPSSFETRWAELVVEAENAARRSWLDRRFVPLSMAVSDLEVRRLRGLQRAAAVAGTARPVGGQKQVPRRFGFELWVETPDGKVGGFIDEVRPSSSGPEVRDYKSGPVQHLTRGDVWTEQYAVQMRLYAALYASTVGTWPAHLLLVGIDGVEVDVPYERRDCDELVRDATARLAAVNATIARATDSDPLDAALATPGIEACPRCPFRPCCRSYRNAWERSEELRAASSDLWGEVRRVDRLGNGKLLLTMSSPAFGAAVQVRGVTASVAHHPAVEWIRAGSPVALFGLRRPVGGGTWAESPWTVLYVLGASAQVA